MDTSRSSVILILMRLGLGDPLRSLETLWKGASSPNKDSLEGYQLLAAILDPAELSTGAPVAGISLIGEKLDLYNDILDNVHQISDQFYSKGGFIDCPESYDSEHQREILEEIHLI